MFPEGYPVVTDRRAGARPAAERDAGGFLPFAPGFRTIAALARRGGARDVTIVPLGFRYELRGRKWHVDARFGAPLDADAESASKRAVRALSR